MFTSLEKNLEEEELYLKIKKKDYFFDRMDEFYTDMKIMCWNTWDNLMKQISFLERYFTCLGI